MAHPTASLQLAAPGSAPAALDAHRLVRFRRGCRVLFAVRAGLLAGLAAIALVPGAAGSLGLHGDGTWLLLGGLALGTFASRLLLAGPFAAPAHFASLCLDAAVLAHLLLASGGLFSPLVGTQLALVAAFGLLFRRPAALLPAFLVLPVAAGLHRPEPLAATDLFLLGWYGALALVAAAALRWLQQRDEEAHGVLAALEESRRARAVLEERARLSREIHDGVGAALSTLVLQAELAGTRVDDAARAEVSGLRTTAEEAIEELRRSVRLLRGDFDPTRAVEELCTRFAERTGLPVACNTAAAAPVRLAPEAQLALFRVLQESLQNAARHASARAIEVRLELGSEGARLRITDDGVGFDPAATPPGHYGLAGMRERARGSGGSLQIHTAPGSGTTIELQLPARASG
ncbi:sensor histidine kinase [Vulgatibacter sp.]|uniref:sensor histidine kinase n=1 Tax=Vulgatibacter sp. TaxID=1971226 RepID=UPI003566E2DC